MQHVTIEKTPELIIRNPANGVELGRVSVTPTEDVAGIVARCRQAQGRWAETPWRERRAVIRRWWKLLARDADAWADALRAEVGKPRSEAMAEVVATLDALRWTVKRAGPALADERIGAGWQRWLLVPSARLRWRPIGVVGMIGTWNYPLLLAAPAIAQGLAAGCGLVWKPSELAALAGTRLQDSLTEAGIPPGLVSTVQGGADVGRALIDADIDKGFFTGGITNGRKVLESLARRGIPAVAELSGFDPAIVLPDAPLESTARALAWSAFVGSGQTCIAVKRIYVVGDPTPWVDALAGLARSLRVGDPSTGNIDVGPLISADARDRFERFIGAAVESGARIAAGGDPLPGPGWFFAPTVLEAETADVETTLAGVFGPVVLVRGVASAEEAVKAANTGPYGLAASVWGRDRQAARAMADRLDAGMIAVNDAVAPSAHAAAPFGGVKGSGIGRTRGLLGLREFVQPQTLHTRRAGGLRPQLFPYSRRVERAMTVYLRMFHG
ncbi:MAG: aldehyde dehydrogenase family protein [Isosphaeraceae bacterium]